MLATPGRSPRHIEPPSPAPSLQLENGENALAVASPSGGIRPPLGGKKSKRKAQVVLEEDTYVAALEKIIERDFFPDIPKLHNKLEWLEASRSGDPVLMQEAQLNIIQRLKAMKAGGVTPMLDSFATPTSLVMPSPAFSTPAARDVQQGASSQGDCDSAAVVDTSLSLDKFMAKFTSEDNDSFAKIIDKVNKRRREKYKYLTEKELNSPQLRITSGGDRATDGYGTSNQPPSTLDTWAYQEKNLLMYDAAERDDDVPLTDAEKEERCHGPPKSINIRGTRFHEKLFEDKQQIEESSISITTPVRAVRKEGEYGYVRTPSPAPGVDASPFMTWGEIEGTPLRLESEDTPVSIGGGGDGPRFKIPAPVPREARAHTLSRAASRGLRERSASRLRHAFSPASSASFSASSAMSPVRVGLLSPAARRFVNKAMMGRSSLSVDAKLRASYGGGSPSRATPSRSRTPSRTPSRMGRSGSVARPEAQRESSFPAAPAAAAAAADAAAASPSNPQ